MKKKSDGTLQGWSIAHRCSQKGGEHCDSFLIHNPMTNDPKMCIMLTLMLMAD